MAVSLNWFKDSLGFGREALLEGMLQFVGLIVTFVELLTPSVPALILLCFFLESEI